MRLTKQAQVDRRIVLQMPKGSWVYEVGKPSQWLSGTQGKLALVLHPDARDHYRRALIKQEDADAQDS